MARHQNRSRSGSDRSGQSAPIPKLTAAPYHFVPLDASLAIMDKPVFHDRLDLEQGFTGELHCTLEALTPLLAANYQYRFRAKEEPEAPEDKSAASQAVQDAYHGLVRERHSAWNEQNEPVKDDKSILEPLMMPGSDRSRPGPVLISGAALKGMFRQSMSALLSAPMERVAELTMSYRPNIKTVTANPLLHCKPALVIGGGGWTETDSPERRPLRALVLKDLRCICFVAPEAVGRLPKRIQDLHNSAWPDGEVMQNYINADARKKYCLTAQEAASIRGVGLSRANILKPGKSGDPSQLTDWLPVKNFNGLDLNADLNRMHHTVEEASQLRDKSPGGYPLLFVNLRGAREVTIPNDRPLEMFYGTLLHLANQDIGHLRNHPFVSKLAEVGSSVEEVVQRLYGLYDYGLLPGDLVFLEQSPGDDTPCITLGHHFYYRWRYRTTVRKTARAEDQTKNEAASWMGLRDVLCPRELETTPEKPEELSGSRLMFGYVGTSKGQYSDSDPLTFGIGVDPQTGEQTDFAQLAGRIACNHAVEQNADRDSDSRFLNGNHAHLVPLRPLGSPKPTAVEHYLTQDRLSERDDAGILCTWGDTPTDNAVGRLRGRKFYLHQPDAVSNASLYELLEPRNEDWKSGTNLNVLSNQAAIGRFISKPGTTFRLCIRFMNLRPWELGALWFTLQPTLEAVQCLCAHFPSNARTSLEDWIQQVEQKGWNANPKKLLAHKLGHGRPLGLGSVRLQVDEMLTLQREGTLVKQQENDLNSTRQQTLKALAEHLQKCLGNKLERWISQCLVPWLRVHRFAGRRSFDYPRLADKKGERTIFNYHSELRGAHTDSRKRRKKRDTQTKPVGLPELDQMDE